jgi:hypothetical protein
MNKLVIYFDQTDSARLIADSVGGAGLTIGTFK